jgi:hypothetical protein
MKTGIERDYAATPCDVSHREPDNGHKYPDHNSFVTAHG